jgi:hypothetical protein
MINSGPDLFLFTRSLATLQYDPAHFNRYFEDKAECKYNAGGTKTEYASPPSSAGPQPPTASTGKTPSSGSGKKSGAKNSAPLELEFAPLLLTAPEPRQQDAQADVKCEPMTALAAAAAFEFSNVELWTGEPSDKSAKVDKNAFDEMAQWPSAGDKVDEFSKMPGHPFHADRVGGGEVGPIQ